MGDAGGWARALLAHVSIALMLGVTNIAHAVVEGAGPGSAGQSIEGPLPDFPQNRVWVMVAIVVVMAFLFWILFLWQKRIEQAGYFAKIFQQTIYKIEAARLSEPYDADWDQGKYLNEVFWRRSERGQQWRDKHCQPSPPDRLLELSQQLDRRYDVDQIRRSMERPQVGTLPPGLGTRNPFGDNNRRPGSYSTTGSLGGSTWKADSISSDRTLGTDEVAIGQEFEALLRQYSQEVAAWIESAATCAWGWYQEDLVVARQAAVEQAESALSVDFSALRGRGPEFVLEFTALVVIIFAAAILGVAHVLEGQQIGTLLAAIAGYVLGKQTGRGQSQSNGQAQERGGHLEIRVKPASPDAGEQQQGKVAPNPVGGDTKG